MHVHSPMLGAPAQGGDRFPGFNNPAGSKRFYCMEHFQFRSPELRAHLIDFLIPTPCSPVIVPPASMHTEYPCAKFLRQSQLSRLVGVIKDERVQISIPRMKNVHAAQAILFRERLDTRQYFGQLLAWYGAIHAVIVW